MVRKSIFLLFLIYFLLLFSHANASPYSLAPYNSLEGGSGWSTGTSFSLNSHLGQAAVGETASGSYRLRAGFYSIIGPYSTEDPDPDGLPNECELQYFEDFRYGPNDDPDEDMISNLDECRLGLDPNSQDFDNDDDILVDWWEILHFGDISAKPDQDPDEDGVANLTEMKLKADPNLADLPGPGLHYEYDALGRIRKIYRIPRY